VTSLYRLTLCTTFALDVEAYMASADSLRYHSLSQLSDSMFFPAGTVPVVGQVVEANYKKRSKAGQLEMASGVVKSASRSLPQLFTIEYDDPGTARNGKSLIDPKVMQHKNAL
jgi:hypothetical protein